MWWDFYHSQSLAVTVSLVTSAMVIGGDWRVHVLKSRGPVPFPTRPFFSTSLSNLFPSPPHLVSGPSWPFVPSLLFVLSFLFPSLQSRNLEKSVQRLRYKFESWEHTPPLHFFGSTNSRFRGRFCDGQYSRTSFLFAVLVLKSRATGSVC